MCGHRILHEGFRTLSLRDGDIKVQLRMNEALLQLEVKVYDHTKDPAYRIVRIGVF